MLQMSLIITFIIIYIVMVLFLFIERVFRFGQKAKDLTTDQTDNKTTKLLGISFSVCMFLLLGTIILDYLEIGLIPDTLIFTFIGILGMIIGIFIRLQSVKTLGEFYTSTLKTSSNQVLINKGLYRYIRNPGYLGNILLFLSTSIALANIVPIIVIPCIIIPVYLKRIISEEIMLSNAFGEAYENYKMNTKRLIPFIY